MNKDLYELKKILYNLENQHFAGREAELLDNLIVIAQQMKNKYIEIEQSTYSNSNIQLEKISQETFLYKPITARNYYEGNYLERFGEMRTSDLRDCNLLEVHNEFWKAYEVQKGNIFASIPQALVTREQAQRLKYLKWDIAEVDVYEVKKCKLTKSELKRYIEKLFKHHVLVLETYSNSSIVLKYNLD